MRTAPDIMRELARGEIEAALLLLYLEGDVGLVVRNGRDPRLATALETATGQFARTAGSSLRLNVEFAQVFGPEARGSHSRTPREVGVAPAGF